MDETYQTAVEAGISLLCSRGSQMATAKDPGPCSQPLPYPCSCLYSRWLVKTRRIGDANGGVTPEQDRVGRIQRQMLYDYHRPGTKHALDMLSGVSSNRPQFPRIRRRYSNPCHKLVTRSPNPSSRWYHREWSAPQLQSRTQAG